MILNHIRIGGIDVEMPVSMDIHTFLAQQGFLYNFTYEDMDFDVAEQANFIFAVGAKNLHVQFGLVATGMLKALLYRSPTFSAIGTEIPSIPFNGVKAKGMLSKIYQGGTITTLGLQLGNGRRVFGYSQGASQISGALDSDVPFILTANTNYLVKLTTLDDNTKYEFSGDIFEEDL